MTIQKLRCADCDHIRFTISWVYETKEQEIALLLCHDGYGFQFEDAIIKCADCGCVKSNIVKVGEAKR